jgi:glycosyltransferase involved in cell wall biosynthesis
MKSGRRITLVGHPFVPIGMGELLRATFRSLRTVGMDVVVRDVYGTGRGDGATGEDLEPHVVHDFGDTNIFVVNGDEVEPVLKHLRTDIPRPGVSVIYPAWELSQYPNTWAGQLERFDEVWAPSQFTYDAIRRAVSKPVVHLPLPGELNLSRLLGRRHFDIPESSFVFLFFFDFTSYIQRKNPLAVLRAFDEVCKRCPSEDVRLVIKTKGGDARQQDYSEFLDFVGLSKNRLIMIENLLTDVEVQNLVRCCDCFVSLHRSEGFGFGLVSAMFLGKPVVATGYSGNLDYMKEGNSCLVRYVLRPVPDGAYPFWQGQVWAEPDVDHAVELMVRLVSDQGYAHQIGTEASRYVRINFSYRAAGLRYLRRINELTPNSPWCESGFVT